MRNGRDGSLLFFLLLHSAGALVANPGILRRRIVLPTSPNPFEAATCATRASPTLLTAKAAAAAASARSPRCCPSQLPTTTVSHARDFWRRSSAARRRGLGVLRATVASWPAVEGTAGDGTGGDGGVGPQGAGRAKEDDSKLSAAAQRVAGGVVLIEQEGPAWTEIVWDEENERFIGADSLLDRSSSQKMRGAVGGLQLMLRHWFIPDDVTPDYYHFTLWRMFQRFVAGTVNVFGTQALLLALGIKARRLGAAAAMSWVLKDALGKFGRILWASKMGRRFDSDAKRWRFRSSLLYAAGNGLEIVTYVFPASFLILAAMANSFKQMSMLTSSATRNTIYRSFALRENIGDITAKGEAQIAVVDLLGMLSGIGLCTLVGTSRHSIVAAYVVLSLIDISAIYNEIRAVVFTVLNHERTHLLVQDYVAAGSDPAVMAQTSMADHRAPLRQAVTQAVTQAVPAPTSNILVGGIMSATTASSAEQEPGVRQLQSSESASPEGSGVAKAEASAAAVGDGPGGKEAAAAAALDTAKGRSKAKKLLAAEQAGAALLSSPSTVSRRENIFLSSRLTTNAFKTWSQAGVSMKGVTDLLRIFGNERYMLAYTEGSGGGGNRGTSESTKRKKKAGAKGVASVILHRDATGADTVKSLLALEYFQHELANAGFEVVGAPSTKNARHGQKKKVVNGSAGVPQNSIAVEGWGKGQTSVGGGMRAGPSPGGVASHPTASELRSCLEAAQRRANEGAPGFLTALKALGWSTEKFMFGNIKSRVEWRL